MKFLPYQFRETQSDFFGKKGLSWHISCLVTRSDDEELDLQCYVHILESGTLGWFSVANIILHLLNNIKSIRQALKEVFLKSDNAACYHCTNLLAFIHQNNTQFPIKVLEYNFSEAHSGKDFCDSKTGSCRMHIYKYANEGHDVMNTQNMKTALESYGGVKGTQACIISVNTEDEPKTKIRIPGISMFNNFTFTDEGITTRKAYHIGEGHIIKNSISQTISIEKVYKPKVHEPFPDNQPNSGRVHISIYEDSRNTSDNIDQQEQNIQDIEEIQSTSENNNVCSPYFCCPDFSCEKVFAKPANLERHLLLGNHSYKNNRTSSMDTAVQIYSSQCVNLQNYQEIVLKETQTDHYDPAEENSISLPDSERRGWGLKSKRANVRFSVKVQNYLQEVCVSCEKTSSRPDYIALSEELKKSTDENGNKLFEKHEWLTPSQIK